MTSEDRELQDFTEWKAQIRNLRHQMYPRFTVVPVTENAGLVSSKPSTSSSSLKTPSKSSRSKFKPQAENSHSGSLYPNINHEFRNLLEADVHHSSTESFENDNRSVISHGRIRSTEDSSKDLSGSTEMPKGRGRESDTSKALVPFISTSWAVEPFQEIPPSLVPIVRPRGTCTPPRIANRNTSANPFARLAVVPHGATIPPLHEMQGSSANLALKKLLKDTGRNIEYGTSDGRSLKVFSTSKSSSQFLGSGSLRETHTRKGEERRHQFNQQGGPSSNINRLHWKSKLEFILTCVGACVGLGSFWRLPYLCLISGRAAFLVPYFLIFCFVGVPLLFAEMVLGQFTQWGPMEAIKSICPLMQGTGVGLLFISLFSSVYHSFIFSESILSLGMVLGETFTLCNTSGALFCMEGRRDSSSPSGQNISGKWNTGEMDSSSSILNLNSSSTETVLTLVITLTGSWVIVYFALWKSVRSISKVTTVSATVPFLLITAFAWRALTLPGATMGLQYFFKPEWNVLKESEVWVNAAVQVLISLNIVFGSSVVFASYNKFWNNITTDVWIISIVSISSSMMGVLVAFSGFGSVAFETGLQIEDIDFEDVDFAFIVYPHILSKMPRKHIWAALFFFLLLLLGLDSQFASVEVIVSTINDRILSPKSNLKIKFLRKLFSKHEILVLVVCLLCFFSSLPFVLQGHTTFAHKKNFRAMNMALLFLALCETLALMWLYGTFRLRRSILQMISKPPSQYYFYCWKLVTPLTILVLWCITLVNYKFPNLKDENGRNQLTGILLGWTVAGLSILPVPLCAILSIYKVGEGSFRERLAKTLTPVVETYPEISRPEHRERKRLPSLWQYFNYHSRRRNASTPSYLPQKRVSAPL